MTRWSHLYPDWNNADDGGQVPVLDDGMGDGGLFATFDDLDDDDLFDDPNEPDKGEVEISSGVDDDDEDDEDDDEDDDAGGKPKADVIDDDEDEDKDEVA